MLEYFLAETTILVTLELKVKLSAPDFLLDENLIVEFAPLKTFSAVSELTMSLPSLIEFAKS